MSKVSFVVVGAGGRGFDYTRSVYSFFPDLGKAVAVCEPDEERRNRFGEKFDVPVDKRFHSWEDLLALPKLADAVFICTQDALHRDPAIALAKKGYHMLLEKPMAPTPEDTKGIYNAVKESGVIFAVCHVLRYTAFNRKLKELIDSGVIGRVHSVQLIEQIGHWHVAHSYVRGSWRNGAESSTMLLAKSCHDIDLLNYFIPSKCSRISSFGSLSHFRRENQPEGAGDRCTECPSKVESVCPYSALNIYYRGAKSNPESIMYWPKYVVSSSGTLEGLLEALEKGPYGRCVYACDNDVVDHQVVNLEFDDGATASFTLCGFTPNIGREIYIMGDRGSLRCQEGDIEHAEFLTGRVRCIPMQQSDGAITSAHGGGDHGLVRDFLTAVKENDTSYISSGPEVTLESHLIVFAAERARINGTVEAL